MEKANNFLTFDRYLTKLIGDEAKDKLFDAVGGLDNVNNASFGMTKDSGCAFEGALLEIVLKIADYACKINEILPESKRVEKTSIYKVALLQHIAKAIMYQQNENSWEVEKRGIVYTFSNRKGVSLKCGELSAFLALSSGVQLTEEEFEAIRIMDKTKEENYNNGKYFFCVLSNIIRQANELVIMEYSRR